MEPDGTRGNHNMMKTSYKKLWNFRIDRGMTMTVLRKLQE